MLFRNDCYIIGNKSNNEDSKETGLRPGTFYTSHDLETNWTADLLVGNKRHVSDLVFGGPAKPIGKVGTVYSIRHFAETV